MFSTHRSQKLYIMNIDKKSSLDPKIKLIVDLANGKKQPANEYERKPLEDIKLIEVKGLELEIPDEFI